jgi:hypothetical protein
VLVVEEAFAMLRSEGLAPGAREALASILDHVMNDFDRGNRQWAERAKYRMLLDSLVDGNKDNKAVPAEVLETRATPSPSQIGDHDSPAVATSLAGLDAAYTGHDFRTVLKSEIRIAVEDVLTKPGAKDLLSSRVPAFMQTKVDKRRSGKYIADLRGRINVFLQVVGDKPISAYTGEDMRRFRDVVDQIPTCAKQRFKTDDVVLAIEKNKRRKEPSRPST